MPGDIERVSTRAARADRDGVSVIIAVKNGERFIAEAIESALAQGSALVDVVVVDDGSTDQTRAIVASFDDRRVGLIANPSKGVSTARNAGVKACVGEWLLFLDADDRLAPASAARLLQAARSDAAVVAAYGDYERIDPGGSRIGRRFLMRGRQKPSGDILPRLLQGNFIINGGILICRRDAFEKAGGFDPALSLCEDWHLWCRLAACGRFAFVPERVMDYRVHPHSVMMGQRRSYRNFVPALEAIFADPMIIANVDRREIGDARRQAEISLLTYCAAQSVRSKGYAEAIGLASDAIRRDARQAPYVVARVLGAAVGM
jgi:glycosyltransferase involved in cell wall biosynthesis